MVWCPCRRGSAGVSTNDWWNFLILLSIGHFVTFDSFLNELCWFFTRFKLLLPAACQFLDKGIKKQSIKVIITIWTGIKVWFYWQNDTQIGIQFTFFSASIHGISKPCSTLFLFRLRSILLHSNSNRLQPHKNHHSA